MAKRILPFRQYDEHDVVNLYALRDADVNENVTGSANGDAGVFVTVDVGNLDLDPVAYADDSYLGKTDFPHVGRNQYPSVSLKIKAATSGESCLGITLRETAKYDENGEKLLYYRQKAEEMMCVLPGEAVPVMTRGLIEVADSAWDGDLTVGGGIKLSAGVVGTVTGCAVNDPERVGMVLGTGSRTSGATADQFAGNVALIQLGL
jgi:hypothetical protein